MLRTYLLKKFIKTAYLSSLYLALFFIVIQLFKIGFLLTGLSPLHTVTFLSLWIIFYFIYFIPNGIIISILYHVFSLREKKQMSVIYSFGISPLKVFSYFMIGGIILFSVGATSGFLLHEEDIAFARKVLLVHYQERIIKTLPERTFYNIGDFVIYVGNKEEDRLVDVFFKYKDFTVIAREAVYEGKGRFYFTKGSLVVKMEGKYFLTFFDSYVLDTIKIEDPEKREKRIYKERIYNLVNASTGIPMLLVGFYTAYRILSYHTHIYYMSAILIFIREIFMFIFKLYLF